MLWELDSLLGVNLQPYAMMTLYSSPILGGISKAVYEAYILGIVLAAMIGSNPERFLGKVAATTVIGSLFYFVVPACGPYFYLTSTATAPRNCMPSLHMTWALMVWYQVRGKSLPVRLAADLFLLFNVIAMVGFGEHYVVDLIAAVPFWFMMECAFTSSYLNKRFQQAQRALAYHS